MDELLREFVIESSENLESIDRDLMTLERDSNSPDVIASVFRAMHTIKGTAGFFDLPRIERLAHTAETLLGKVRDGELAATSERVSALLRVADTLRGQLASLEETGSEGDADIDELVDALVALGDPSADAGAPAPPAPAKPKGTRSRAKKAPTAPKASEPEAPTPDVEDEVEVLEVVEEAVAAASEPEPASAPAVSGPAAAAGGDRPQVAESSIRVDIGVL